MPYRVPRGALARAPMRRRLPVPLRHQGGDVVPDFIRHSWRWNSLDALRYDYEMAVAKRASAGGWSTGLEP